MKTLATAVLLFSLSQYCAAQPPEGVPAVDTGLVAPDGRPLPPNAVPMRYAAPHPPVAPGAWWYGATVPVVHQRVIYYPSWDLPYSVLFGCPVPGAPANDIPQAYIQPFWKRLGQ